MTQQPESVWVLHDTGNLIPPEDDIRVFVDKPALMFGLRQYIKARYPKVAKELKLDELSDDQLFGHFVKPRSKEFHDLCNRHGFWIGLIEVPLHGEPR
jgi:hypothetical protein